MPIDAKHQELQGLRIDRSQRGDSQSEPPTWAKRYILIGIGVVLALSLAALAYRLLSGVQEAAPAPQHRLHVFAVPAGHRLVVMLGVLDISAWSPLDAFPKPWHRGDRANVRNRLAGAPCSIARDWPYRCR